MLKQIISFLLFGLFYHFRLVLGVFWLEIDSINILFSISGASGTRSDFKGFLCLISLSRFDKMNCFQLFPSSFQDFLRQLYPKLMFLASLVCMEQVPHSTLIKALQCPCTSRWWDQLVPVVASPFCGFPSQLYPHTVFRWDLYLFHLCQSCHMFHLKEYLPVMTSRWGFHTGWVTPP